MCVKELIEQLRELPQDAAIAIEIGSECQEEFMTIPEGAEAVFGIERVEHFAVLNPNVRLVTR